MKQFLTCYFYCRECHVCIEMGKRKIALTALLVLFVSMPPASAFFFALLRPPVYSSHIGGLSFLFFYAFGLPSEALNTFCRAGLRLASKPGAVAPNEVCTYHTVERL